MKHWYRTAALAMGALLCISASQAFAGISLVRTGTSASWTMTWTVNQAGGIGNVVAPFTTIVATTAGATTYTVSSGTFTVSNPSLFEDLGSAGVHRAWSGFSDASWAQTVPSGSGASNVSTTTAAGNQVLGSGLSSITFTLNFTGLENMNSNSQGTNGAHYFLDFFDASGTKVTTYEIKDVIGSNGVQGTEITQTFALSVPLPASVWGGLAMFGGMAALLAVRRRRSRLPIA